MKIQINMPGDGVVYSSVDPSIINRKQLCSQLSIDNTEFCRIEKIHGFDFALKILLEKKRKRSMM